MLYAEDGQLLAPGGAFLRGRPEIQAYWQSRMDTSVRQAELEMLDLEDYGDLALERTRYTMRDGHGRVVDTGKYVVLWARVNGHWELHRDILNSGLS
jgi:ketosteroid isomerase-like protein